MNVKYLIRKHSKNELEVYAQYAVNSGDPHTPVYIEALREIGTMQQQIGWKNSG